MPSYENNSHCRCLQDFWARTNKKIGSPFSVNTGLAWRNVITLVHLSKGQVTCFHVINSVTCLASCQNFSKLTCPLGNLKDYNLIDNRFGAPETGENLFSLDLIWTYLLEQPSLRKYKSLTRSEKKGMTILCLWSVAPADRHMAAFSVDR